MTPSRTIRLLLLGTMLLSMAVLLMWAAYFGWRKWPKWRAVRAMRAAVEAAEPGPFLDAVKAVDKLDVADAAADEVAPLRHHPSAEVRMYAVIAQTLFGPHGPSEAQKLITLFDDPDEDAGVRYVGLFCLTLLDSNLFDNKLTMNDFPSLKLSYDRMINDPDDPRRRWFMDNVFTGDVSFAPGPDATREDKVSYLVSLVNRKKWLDAMEQRRAK